MPEKPKPKPPPGVNSEGRTPAEQKIYEDSQKSKNSGTNPAPDMIDNYFSNLRSKAMKPLPKGMGYKVMAGSPNMAKIAAIAKAKKKMVKSGIQKSPTN